MATVYNVHYDFTETVNAIIERGPHDYVPSGNTYDEIFESCDLPSPKLVVEKVCEGAPNVIMIQCEGYCTDGIIIPLDNIPIPEDSSVSIDCHFNFFGPIVSDVEMCFRVEAILEDDFGNIFYGHENFVGVSMPEWQNVKTFFSTSKWPLILPIEVCGELPGYDDCGGKNVLSRAMNLADLECIIGELFVQNGFYSGSEESSRHDV